MNKLEILTSAFKGVSEVSEFKIDNVFPSEEIAYRTFLNQTIKKIILTRVEKGISQIDLADKVGISKVSLCRIERRAAAPSLETLYKIASCLDLAIIIQPRI